MWREEESDIFYQKALHRLRPKNERVLPELMLHFMPYAACIGLFSEFTSQSSIAHLTREKLAIIPMLVPPEDEQPLIVGRLDSIDEQINCERRTLQKRLALKSGLMQDLLTGKVRVKVDKAEEVEHA